MEDLRRIERPIAVPQPVGSGTRSQPGRDRRDAFRDLLERERRGEREPSAESPAPAPRNEDEDEEQREPGGHLDERA